MRLPPIAGPGHVHRASMRPARVAVLALAAVTSFVSYAACAGPGKREARALLTAIDRYRHADGPSRDGEARAIVAVPCSDARVCDAKQACLDAIEPTTRALGLKNEVARRIMDIEQKRLSPDSAGAQALPGELDEAAKLLGAGRARMPDCEKKLTDLQIEHGL